MFVVGYRLLLSSNSEESVGLADKLSGRFVRDFESFNSSSTIGYNLYGLLLVAEDYGRIGIAVISLRIT